MKHESVRGNSFDGFCVCNRPILKSRFDMTKTLHHSSCLSSFPELLQKLYNKNDFLYLAEWNEFSPMSSISSSPPLPLLFIYFVKNLYAYSQANSNIVSSLKSSLTFLGKIILLSLIFSLHFAHEHYCIYHMVLQF